MDVSVPQGLIGYEETQGAGVSFPRSLSDNPPQAMRRR